MSSPSSIEMSSTTALRVFTSGLARSRSVASPAEAIELGPVIVVRDVPGSRRIPRGQEVMVPADVAIDDALNRVKQNASLASASICVLREEPDEDRSTIDSVKAHGYRYLRSEPLMVRSTGDIDRSPSGIDVRCVSSLEEAHQVDKLAGARQFLPSDLDQSPSPVRVYYALVDGAIAGYARSVNTPIGPSYLAGMYTVPERRRQGIATGILRTLLADEARIGIESNVLVATRDGEKLYRSLGYKTLGILYVFKPVRK